MTLLIHLSFLLFYFYVYVKIDRYSRKTYEGLSVWFTVG
jgi:hypothetical protein